MQGEGVPDFGTWVAARGDAVARSAFLLTGDVTTAEDLAQTALVRVYRRWDKLDHSSGVDAYVRQILVRCWRSWWQRRLRHETAVADVPETADRDAIADRGVRIDLMRALAALPPRQRAVVVLRYFDDLTEAQAAVALGCSVGTVKSQTSRALAKLKDALAPANATTTRNRS